MQINSRHNLALFFILRLLSDDCAREDEGCIDDPEAADDATLVACATLRPEYGADSLVLKQLVSTGFRVLRKNNTIDSEL